MKLTFILDTFAGGGKERRCLQLIQGLNKIGYNNIQVIVIDGLVAYNELFSTDIILHRINHKDRSLGFLNILREIRQQIDNYNPDIVQSWGIFSSIFTSTIRLTKRFKYICSFVADCNKPNVFSRNGLSVRLSYLLADYIVGNSSAGLIAYSVPNKKAKLIYNGFNDARLLLQSSSAESIKKQIGLNKGFVVSMIARLTKSKDQATFIKAAKSILKYRDDIVFLLVGTGEEEKNLRSLVESQEENFIKFLGFRNDVEHILEGTDISVMCTNPKVHKEGISNTILESFAFSVPVLATNDGGTPEIIEDQVNGVLLEPFNHKQLSEDIIDLIDNDIKRERLSANAFNTVKKKFSLDKMVNEFDVLYKQTIQE